MWQDEPDRNSLAAFVRSFRAGFGAEIDIRDQDGRLVVSHDPPRGTALGLDEVLAAYDATAAQLPLAINVKADGLQDLLTAALAPTGVSDYFVFDMSVPDTLGYAAHATPFFTRLSEHEPDPVLYDQAAGVWVDCFEDDWVEEDHVGAHLDSGKRVCLVSPELHGRPFAEVWETWASWSIRTSHVLVCTDHPTEAAAVLS